MHIADGVLSTPVLVVGIALSAIGTAIGLRKLQDAQIPFAAVLSACFFVASLIHFPLGPSSVHLVFSGIIGLLLGWVAFPVILIALILQAVFFSFGGIVVLGVNCLNMALPAVVIGLLLRPLRNKISPRVLGFLAGSSAIVLTGTLVSLSLYLSGDAFVSTANAVFIANLPLAALEGIIASFVIVFINKVKPEVLNGVQHHD
ncbi:cobalt transporter CbiM [Shewanella intestini]|uniref:Cobalt transporter CbiM n=1 Tax=Shewanella intestini TaxID=2017544 RepID=A0ABS5HYM0_9GAMM|nr:MULTISPECIES: cobalt transporter CbiM [Shewanella]MBR9726866.1 cobalt transporter CbiM [Shewanella intestini]MRG34568.1 cobalt transporter CbiM [Shewanella sp. XMDDZSB0408]